MTEKRTILDDITDIPIKKFLLIIILGGLSLWVIAMIILLLFLHFAYPR